MMNVLDIVDALQLEVYAGENSLEKDVEGGYIGDLLSFVMSHAKENNIWFTIQGHINSVAVASLLGLSAVVLTDGVKPSADMIHKANEENIPILGARQSSFDLLKNWPKE